MARWQYRDVSENDALLEESGIAREAGTMAKDHCWLSNAEDAADIKSKCRATDRDWGERFTAKAEQTAARSDLRLETRGRRNVHIDWRFDSISSRQSFFETVNHFLHSPKSFVMVAFSAGALLLTLRVLLTASSASAAPIAQPQTPAPPASGSGFWIGDIKRQGQVAFGGNTSYTIFRNVKDFGATGDGTTDDTAAINRAVSEGGRCGEGCDSSTITPAIVYFPPGTYVVSDPIIQYYYTQFIGDANQLPTIKASGTFKGMGMIDADPYIEGGNGANWYTNQNNFYRQIRNFILDISAAPGPASAIHWQVSQATSLQNIKFVMEKGEAGAQQQGIFQDNGSGGFMADLTFTGGKIGAFLGSQQFTTRNLTFNDCGVGIYMNWNWLWTLKSVTFNNCKVGLDMANAPENQTVGSVILMDSKFVGTPIGVNTSFSQDSIPHTGGSLILDNVDFTGSNTAVQDFTGKAILPGGKEVSMWAQGNALAAGAQLGRVQGDVSGAPQKPASLQGTNGFFERSKPQYENVAASSFVSLKAAGAKGDGQTDDTKAIQDAINSLEEGQILYADHGAYLIKETIVIPAEKNIKMTGEIWPLFMATGDFFKDQADPKPAIQVGAQSGDKGSFEMSDIIVTTAGPAPGAILMEWNINGNEAGTAGLWDVHFRVGGFEGTQLQSSNCAKNPNATHPPNEECIGSFMQLHVTKQASGYFENVWLWTADHELDQDDHGQIDIYNGRGMLVESQGPVWLWGTASEHSQLSQYHFQGAKDIFFGAIQTETPYYQPNPSAAVPFKKNDKYFDPDFEACTTEACKSAWGVRIIDSESIWNYGAGVYSFFSNYDQKCVPGQNCQSDINQIENSTNVNIFALSTKASVNMITSGGQGIVKDEDNRSNFCATLAIFAQA
ncbi:glycoside hydrolase family 55 protein [Aaosphaeria arxii CBS 175.79]|uniref:Glycoside hydrolase family 55 protein n=1 Tax=Aaosphaeria arxii CBS 175.79 TaxID=1450172 RepID=A0A6A5XE05_9PLEO|nr:glycoside hydrolase family 55 protein [Aaosphaeria arxii CBS 175.79]KAF2011120.1 glycoside hydrolase family 55 protein [Aaosphaeria arxii CBS 175.79]